MKERIIYSDNRFVYVRRKSDGQMLDMSERVWFENMGSNADDFEFMGYVDDINQTVNDPPKYRTPDDENMFACPLCGKAYKTDDNLKKHRTKDHA